MSKPIKGKITTHYPCCKGACILPYYAAVKREGYERRCPNCGKQWSILRREIISLGNDGSKIDQLDWEQQ